MCALQAGALFSSSRLDKARARNQENSRTNLSLSNFLKQRRSGVCSVGTWTCTSQVADPTRWWPPRPITYPPLVCAQNIEYHGGAVAPRDDVVGCGARECGRHSRVSRFVRRQCAIVTPELKDLEADKSVIRCARIYLTVGKAVVQVPACMNVPLQACSDLPRKKRRFRLDCRSGFWGHSTHTMQEVSLYSLDHGVVVRMRATRLVRALVHVDIHPHAAVQALGIDSASACGRGKKGGGGGGGGGLNF